MSITLNLIFQRHVSNVTMNSQCCVQNAGRGDSAAKHDHIPMNKNVLWNAPPAAVGVLCEASNRETADRMPGPNI